MNIALDATYSIGRNLTGVGVYSRELLFGLAAAHPDVQFLFCYRAHRLFPSLKEMLPPNASRAWLRASGFGPRSAALFHGLNQRLDRVRTRKMVSTFHDLFVLTGDYSTSEFRNRFSAQARQAAERSDLVITVSEFTADQMVEVLGFERSRIRVVHHGVRPPTSPPPGDAERENLILHVGAIQHRKNLLRLIEAFEQTPEGWNLVLAGSAGYGAAEILARIEHSPRRSSITLPGYVSSGELEHLYRRARIFAFPSLDEGFGMPILDAMARGVPVLTSNRSATKEVAGDAALQVNPLETDSVASGLLQLVSYPGLRRKVSEDGLVHAARFSWEAAVAKTWLVYRELL